jgi:TRAP-type C4-dicarboxylate transport system substrate-binding protein
MKRRSWAVTAVLLGLAAGAWLAAATPAPAQSPLVIRFGHYQPRGPAVEGEGRLADLINQRSGGRLKVEVGWAEAFGKTRELPGLLRAGALDMVAMAPHFDPDPFPFWRTVAFPTPVTGSSESMMERQHQIARMMLSDPAYEKELAERFNARPVLLQLLAPYYLLGKNPGCGLEVLKGKKVRTLGADHPKMIAAAGGTPVGMPTPELYEALLRGTVDYLSIPTTHMLTLKLHEAGKHACGPYFMFAMGHLTAITLDTWKRIPPDLQKLVQDTASEVQDWYLQHLKQTEGTDKQKLQALKMEFTAFPAAQMEDWRKRTPDFVQAWVTDMKAKGQGAEAERVAGKLRAILGH